MSLEHPVAIRRVNLGLNHMSNGPIGQVAAASFAVGQCSHMSGILARFWTAGHDEIWTCLAKLESSTERRRSILNRPSFPEDLNS